MEANKKNIKVSAPISESLCEEKNRGRIEVRKLSVYENLQGIDKSWLGEPIGFFV